MSVFVEISNKPKASNGEKNGFKLIQIIDGDSFDVILNADQFERLEMVLDYIFNNEPLIGTKKTEKKSN